MLPELRVKSTDEKMMDNLKSANVPVDVIKQVHENLSGEWITMILQRSTTDLRLNPFNR